MALGLNNGGGNSDGSFLPICKYDARAGRLFRVDRSQRGDGSYQSDNVDISQPAPQFAVDMGSIQVGWLAFSATGPDFHLVPFGSPMPAKPSSDHKAGFRVKLGGKIMGGVRELAASSKCVLSAIDGLHTAYEAAPEAASGKIPLVKMTGTKPITTKGPQGTTTNYAPVFEIVGWVDRLPDMGERTVALPRAVDRASKPVSNHVPPPAPKTDEVDWDEDLNQRGLSGIPQPPNAPSQLPDDVMPF